jgi:hypothetical protein
MSTTLTAGLMCFRAAARGGSPGDRFPHRADADTRQRLGFMLDAIERLMLPVDARLMESDGVAMENCGEHDFDAACAFETAAALIGRAARSLPAAPVQAAVRALLADDTYGVRCPLGVIATE